jgi:hypothetical protein
MSDIETDEAVRVTIDDLVRNGAPRIGALLAELLALRQERDALREKCRELEPRPLREGDEAASSFSGANTWKPKNEDLVHVNSRPRDYVRIVRVPLAAAEPAGEPEKNEAQAKSDLGRVFIGGFTITDAAGKPNPISPEEAVSAAAVHDGSDPRHVRAERPIRERQARLHRDGARATAGATQRR